MPKLPSPLDACRLDLFTTKDELVEKYPAPIVARVLRLREEYNHWLDNPGAKDRDLCNWITEIHRVSRATAYSDINILHQLVPLISVKSREFHRARANEMFLETYEAAKAKGDLKTMSQTAAAYARYNDVGNLDESEFAFTEPPIQPFSATTDPTVLGLKPIPNISEFIAKLTKSLSRDSPDILDVECEEPDLEESFIFDSDGKIESQSDTDLL